MPLSHSDAAQPAFTIDILKSTDNGVSWTSLYAVDHRANEGGWQYLGANASGDSGAIWYNSAIVKLDLASLSLDTLIKVDLNIKDCGEGGHGGLVLLDGFGTTEIKDPVPEPATMLLMGTGLVGLIGARRKKKA